MKRKIYDELLRWKDKPRRKPLLLQGARQVGKTYCLEQLGQKAFPDYHLFDFMENPALCKVFDADFHPDRILRDLGLLIDKQIEAERELIIFDEIQQCPRALTALKYFAQQKPRAYIAASGSLLGVELSSEPFPVGKINRYRLYPMDFDEFLSAMGQERLIKHLSSVSAGQPVTEPVHQKIWQYFKYFMITGGLPEVVKVFRTKRESLAMAFNEVRKLQKELLQDYKDDMAKHSGKIKSVKISAVFNNVPVQLARENRGNKKFVFKDVLPNASRYASLEGPIEWLIKAGLIIKVPICNNAGLPLQAYTDEKRFKLYLFDVGILGCMVDLSPKTVHAYDYGSYKGYFAENIVLTELMKKWDGGIYSWNRNSSEIEFLMEYEGRVVPIEVKAGISSKAKSLKVFNERYAPRDAVLLSGRPMLPKKGNLLQIPLYMASKFHLLV